MSEGPPAGPKGWAEIAEEARRRIYVRDWAPGQVIPSEEALAVEFGVARATVNRALRALAEEGWVERRRRAGTRVAERPVRRATFSIPLIRDEVEQLGRGYRYAMQSCEEVDTPGEIATRLAMQGEPRVLRITALHRGDGWAYAWEERWINPGVVPEARGVDWRIESPNEWLLAQVPYTEVAVSVGAEAASEEVAGAFLCEPGTPLLSLERTTWSGQWGVTFVRLSYAPGHRMWSRM